MITFHPQQFDCGQCAHQKAGASALQISVTNCTAKLRGSAHEAGKSSATIFKEQCKSTSLNLNFRHRKPYPLSEQGFCGSFTSRRWLRGVPRDGHATAAPQSVQRPRQHLTRRLARNPGIQSRHSKIMNTPSTPDLEGLRKAVQEFRPHPHRVPFNSLKPVHDSIIELRKRGVSYSAIAELLHEHGVQTSRARVAEYGRIVLEGGKKRKRRKRTKAASAANVSQSAPATVVKPAPATPAPAAIVNLPLPKENPAFTSRGPRIAKVEQLPPKEAEEFLASMKAENAAKP